MSKRIHRSHSQVRLPCEIDCMTHDKLLVLLKKQTDCSIDKLGCKNLFELLILDLFQFFTLKDLVKMYKLKKKSEIKEMCSNQQLNN